MCAWIYCVCWTDLIHVLSKKPGKKKKKKFGKGEIDETTDEDDTDNGDGDGDNNDDNNNGDNDGGGGDNNQNTNDDNKDNNDDDNNNNKDNRDNDDGDNKDNEDDENEDPKDEIVAIIDHAGRPNGHFRVRDCMCNILCGIVRIIGALIFVDLFFHVCCSFRVGDDLNRAVQFTRVYVICGVEVYNIRCLL